MKDTLTLLNAPTAAERLRNLRRLLPDMELPTPGADVNNHIHTTFSFSPYSPTAAAWMARREGLCTAGVMDHDSIAGAREFLEACALLGVGGTCGLECRVKMTGTPLESLRINNPDQAGVAYILLHSVPHDRIEEVDAFFAPLRAFRNDRNRQMVARINDIMAGAGIRLDFDLDVLPLSQYLYGGSVTERHLSSALAYALEEAFGRGEALVNALRGLGKPVSAKAEAQLAGAENPYFHYDLIGWIKAELVPDFYVDASDECADVRDVLALSERVGAISAYSYLGDVGESVTGDKRAQAFEDGYLDTLFETVSALGFRAITYMPTRNTDAQLTRLRRKIAEGGFFEVSGEDINQPRQSFVCEKMRGAEFDALRDGAWAMIAHERAAHGLFSKEAIAEHPDLTSRVRAFAERGRRYAGV